MFDPGASDARLVAKPPGVSPRRLGANTIDPHLEPWLITGGLERQG